MKVAKVQEDVNKNKESESKQNKEYECKQTKKPKWNKVRTKKYRSINVYMEKTMEQTLFIRQFE